MRYGNADPYHIAMVVSLIPLLSHGTIAFWIGQHIPFIPRTWSEGRIDLLTWFLLIALALCGTLFYVLYSPKASLAKVITTIGIFIFINFLLYITAKIIWGEADD
jgi:hypothetical protein